MSSWASYEYDALGRRTAKLDHTENDPVNYFTPWEFYYYDGDRVIEIFRTVMDEDPASTDDPNNPPGDFAADACPQAAPPPPPSPPPPKRSFFVSRLFEPHALAGPTAHMALMQP